MDDRLRHGFRLGGKQVLPLEDRIVGPAGSVHLAPRVMDLLLCLAEHAGEIVERSVIGRRVWDDPDVTSDMLNHAVSELRHSLASGEDDRQYIRTVPKRGYQLVAPIDADGVDDAPAAANPSAIVALLESLRRRRVFRAVGAYAIFAWFVLQVADIVTGPLGFPDWTMTVVVVIAILGFPLSVALAWTFQITESGIVVDAGAGSAGTRELRLRPVDYVIAGTLIVILGIIAVQLATRDDSLVIETESGRFMLPAIETGPVSPLSIAVLPFINIGADREGEFLGLGIAEEVLNLLANIKELKVSSRQSSFQFGGGDNDVGDIAQKLRVRNILEGSVQGDGEELRITAQLIDARSGYHVWSQTYRRENQSMLAIRDDIAKAVVDSLRVVLSVESESLITAAPTQVEDAYDYYLQALTYLRRPKTEQTLTNAEGLFQRALDLDPDYAQALAGLCEVYLGKYQQFSRTEFVQPAEQACDAALTQDANLPEVHAALGSLYRATGQYDKAELAFQRAIVLNPKLEPAFYGLGRVYMAQNRLPEAEQLFLYAVKLEPGYWGTHLALGNYYLEFGRPAEAIEPFRRVTELRPDYANGYNNLGAALYNSGDVDGAEMAYLTSIRIAPVGLAYSNLGTMYYNVARFDDAANMYRKGIEITPENFTLWGRLAAANMFIPGNEDEARQDFRAAIELAKKNLAINPNDAKTLSYIAYYYANVDEADEARNAIDRALELGPNDPNVYYFQALVEVCQENPDAAVAALERAAVLGYAVGAIASDPFFAALRADPRFRAIVD